MLILTLALAPLAVLSLKFSLADIEQCGPLAITFSQDKPLAADLPLTLTVIPFNSLPISVPIPNTAVTSPAVSVAFLPLEEGTTFVASLTNLSGDGFTSGVVKILPSPTGDSTCLSSVANSTPRRFSTVGPVSQCQPFNVTYNTTVIDHPPSIRVFSPLKYSFAINKTDTSMDGTDTYLMSAAHQTEVVLLFDDGLDYRETSDLLAVGGDSTSDNSCLLAAEQTTSPPQKKLPKGLVIGIFLTVGIFLSGIAIITALFITRERGRRRRGRLSNFIAARMVRQRPPSANMSSSLASRFVLTPPYVGEKSPSASEFIYYPWGSTGSLEDATQRPWRAGSQQTDKKAVDAGLDAGLSPDQQSLSSLDIEYLLNMATIYSEPPLRPLPVAAPSKNPALLTVPLVHHRHLRGPSDVPSDTLSRQSLSEFFPNRISRDDSSTVTYPSAPHLTVSTRSGLSSYSTLALGQAQLSLQPNTLVPPWASEHEHVSSFPVSVTSSLSPPRPPWDEQANPNSVMISWAL